MMKIEYETMSAISSLISEFAWRLDQADGDGAASLFVERGRLITPVHPMDGSAFETIVGRDSLATRWAGFSEKFTRHLFSNLRISQETPDQALSTSSVIAFHHHGDNIREARIHLVSDWFDQYRRCEDGEWRFVERKIEPTFWGKASFPHLFK